MNLDMSVRVTLIDEETKVYKLRPVTQVAAEKNFDCSLLDVLDRRRLTDIYWIAWHAATGGSVPFDDWLARVDEIDVITGAAADPTQTTPSPGESAPSL